MLTKKNHKQDIEITKLVTNMEWVLEELKDIKGNHLSGIYRKLESHKNWLIAVLGALILNLIAIIFSIIRN